MANVFLLADALPLGGVTSYIKTLAATLQQRGHRVTVLIHEGEDEGEEPWPKEVKLHRIPVGPFDTRSSVTRRVRRHLTAAGAEWVFFNNCFFTDSSAIRGTAMQGVYVVHSNAESEVERFRKEGMYCRYLVGPAPAVTARFAGAFPNCDIRCIAHGTPVPEARIHKPSSPFEVLYIGRLSPEKGVDLLPGILAPLFEKFSDTRCTILGNAAPADAAYADDVRRALRQLMPDEARLQLRTSAPGVKAAALPAAHVILVPSRAEAFGLVAIEGAAWGAVPVVTCIAGVTDRIFEDGVDAMLIAREDANAFATALIKLREDATLRERLAEAAFKKVRARFSVEAMADAYEALMTQSLPPVSPRSNVVQRAYALYRHILFLRARRMLRRG